ncbi:hypothetical protein Bca4012_074924 [Brassica carinata]
MRDDGGDTERSERVVVFGGGFRFSLCHGEDENEDGGSVVVSIGPWFQSFVTDEKPRDEDEEQK